MSTTPDWKQLELLVAEIQRQLAPGARVTHNARMPGLRSGSPRQVDVLLEQSIGPFSMRIAIDCKDHKTPVDVKGVEEFRGLMEDIGANKGALVCPSGFTRTARKRAEDLQIDLHRPVDLESKKYNVAISLPVVCDFRSAGLAFGLRSSSPYPLEIRQHIGNLIVFDEGDAQLGTYMDLAAERWNSGGFPTETGVHDNVPLRATGITKIDNGFGLLIEVDLYVGVHVKRQRYFGALPVTKVRGLIDEQRGILITNAFTVGGLNPNHVQSSWMKLDEGQEPPTRPTLQFVGLHVWGEV